MTTAFGGFWAGKRVFVTGHTGFKGAWLCHWLIRLGAIVCGYSTSPKTNPSLFDLLALSSHLQDVRGDLCDLRNLKHHLQQFRPEVVLHLAAQSLVKTGYDSPLATWETNVGGTVNLLECLRQTPSVSACVVVTSDKCYEESADIGPFRETDRLGGSDPYSASKGACELAVASWRRSFFSLPGTCNIATARAGNAIGGGDWNEGRIVTDIVRSILGGRPVNLRNPNSIRPWQHVLEPVSGYLTLARCLCGAEGRTVADAWNFGPSDCSNATVQSLAQEFVQVWGDGSWTASVLPDCHYESRLLRLDCSKAASQLGWKSAWSLHAAIERTARWYQALHQGESAEKLVDCDIKRYEADAGAAGLSWAIQ